MYNKYRKRFPCMQVLHASKGAIPGQERGKKQAALHTLLIIKCQTIDRIPEIVYIILWIVFRRRVYPKRLLRTTPLELRPYGQPGPLPIGGLPPY